MDHASGSVLCCDLNTQFQKTTNQTLTMHAPPSFSWHGPCWSAPLSSCKQHVVGGEGIASWGIDQAADGCGSSLPSCRKWEESSVSGCGCIYHQATCKQTQQVSVLQEQK